jgi:hypothetical protein
MQAEKATAEREAAELNGEVVYWHTALDNYVPIHRAEAYGYGVRYTHPVTGSAGFRIYRSDAIKDARRSIVILDDGRTAVPYYCAGWHAEAGYVLYQPFPVNPEGKRRPDNGRVIDFNTWMLGPRRMYHFKLSPVPR